jgi:DNA-binding HxlR family transcriptional regulator
MLKWEVRRFFVHSHEKLTIGGKMSDILQHEWATDCPIEVTLTILGGKWKPLILFHLLEETKRFGELQRLMPQVTREMLTQHLRQLEADGIIHREVYQQVPPKVEYSLTDIGRTLTPILQDMNQWGGDYRRSREPALPAQL